MLRATPPSLIIFSQALSNLPLKRIEIITLPSVLIPGERCELLAKRLVCPGVLLTAFLHPAVKLHRESPDVRATSSCAVSLIKEFTRLGR